VIPPTYPEPLSARKAAERLKHADAYVGLSWRNLYRLANRDEVPHRRYGAKILFYEPELRLWIDGARLVPCPNGLTVEQEPEHMGEVP
jgi:hypothetical protein